VHKGKELNDFQRNPLDIEILSNLRFGSLEIRDTSVTRVTSNFHKLIEKLVSLLKFQSGPTLWGYPTGNIPYEHLGPGSFGDGPPHSSRPFRQ
jgi:hypothetical protein